MVNTFDFSTIEGFEWDQWNREKIKRKHQVEWKECEELFQNSHFLIIFPDEEHSQEEKRFGAFGLTSTGRGLAITFTIRNNKIRMVTARDQSKKERSEYKQLLKV